MTHTQERRNEARIQKILKRKQILKIMKNWDFQSGILPDFGFDLENIDQKDRRGWDLIYDFVRNKYKFERLENYVEARQILLRQIEQIEKHK